MAESEMAPPFLGMLNGDLIDLLEELEEAGRRGEPESVFSIDMQIMQIRRELERRDILRSVQFSGGSAV